MSPTLPLDLNVVFVSGPKGSGRTETGLVICRNGVGRWVLDAYRFELRERCHAAYRLHSKQSARPLRHDFFDKQIDVPLAPFEGLSPLRAYEKFEAWARDAVGDGCLGKWQAVRLGIFVKMHENEPPERRPQSVVIVDAQRPEDCAHVVRAVGANRCTLLRVGRTPDQWISPGCSSGPLFLDGVRSFNILNPGDTLEGLEAAVRAKVPDLFPQPEPEPEQPGEPTA